jgi:hypothetical protein
MFIFHDLSPLLIGWRKFARNRCGVLPKTCYREAVCTITDLQPSMNLVESLTHADHLVTRQCIVVQRPHAASGCTLQVMSRVDGR